MQQHERTHGRSQWHPKTHPASDIRLLPAEVHRASTRTGSILDDPDLAGNPVALAHARATRGNHPAKAGSGRHPIGTALLFLVVVPAIIFLVSNPLGWVLLLGLCFGFGYLFGFGGIL